MKRTLGKATFSLFAILLIVFSFQPVLNAQSPDDELSPKTQQYIDNLNEVQQAQNAGQPNANNAVATSQGSGFWTIVFYGFLSSVAYAVWRWVKRLRNRD